MINIFRIEGPYVIRLINYYRNKANNLPII